MGVSKMGEEIAKICGNCGKYKTLDKYHKNIDGLYGRASYCKQCRSEKAKEWYDNGGKDARKKYHDENREQHINRMSEWYNKNKEDQIFRNKRNAANREWYKQNKEYYEKYNKENRIAVNRNKRKYHENNKEKIAVWHKNYKKRTPEKQKKYKYKRRGYGFKALNKALKATHGHHLHLEGNHDFVIFVPNFIHTMFGHRSDYAEAMISINSIALDLWINESLYNRLYYKM